MQVTTLDARYGSTSQVAVWFDARVSRLNAQRFFSLRESQTIGYVSGSVSLTKTLKKSFEMYHYSRLDVD